MITFVQKTEIKFFQVRQYLMDVGSGLVDALDEELDELVDLHPVVADVTQLVSVVEEDVS